MADGDKQASENEADKLREVFHSKYSVEDFLEKNLYDQRDVDNIKNNDLYVRQFIRKNETLVEAADRLHEALKWRKEIGIRDLTEESFPRQFFDKGGVFYHNVDKDGHKLLYVAVKKHQKDASLLPGVKKFFAHFLEAQYREDPTSQITLVFDMAGAGLSNLDMDLIKFVITSFKLYYPSLLHVMLIYEMPWLFNAAWKIIKTWLSAEAVKKIKFITRNDVQEYINKDQLLEHMGGTDKFEYQYFSPEERLEEENKANKKKVTFADQDKESPYEANKENIYNLNNSADPKQQTIPGKSSIKSPTPSQKIDDNSFVGRFLTITPADELVFQTDDQQTETYELITLKNAQAYSVAYKVKTTSPEKYRVRPSAGIIKAGTSVEITVYLQQGYNSVSKDKFLIMAMEVAGDPTEPLQKLWKTVPKENIMEHRLKCDVIHKSGSQDSIASMLDPIVELNVKVDDLMETNRRLERTIRMLLLIQLLLMILIVLYLYFFYFKKSYFAEYCCAKNMF